MSWNASFRISYNANGGYPTPSDQSHTATLDEATSSYSYTFSVSSTKPTRTGYNFTGWSGTHSFTATRSAPSHSGTMVAGWSKKTYKVTYDANGGSGAPSSQTKTYGTTLTLSSTVPTRERYTFTGWNTSDAGSGTTYAIGASYTKNATLDLYAMWALTSWKVTYNANGGTGAPAAQDKIIDTVLTITSAEPTRSGHVFLKWNTKADGSGTDYYGGDSYTTNASLSLFAIWSVDSFTVTYDANGGSGAPSAQTKQYGQALALSSTIPTLTGHTFSGWSESAQGEVRYQAGGTYTEEANATLYAKYAPIQSTVTFDSRGGSSVQPKTVTYGETYGTLPAPTRQFYSFDGWFTAASGGTQVHGTDTVTTTQAQTLYAQWTNIETPHETVHGTAYVMTATGMKRCAIGRVQSNMSVKYGATFVEVEVEE